MKLRLLYILSIVLLYSCSSLKQIDKSAKENVLHNTALQTAHVGICIFEPATGKYWYNYQGDKYFVPASNTKLPTCYAAMKHLRDSIPGLQYEIVGDELQVFPTGDPTFLHHDYKDQPVYDFLKNANQKIVLSLTNWQDERWGNGWSWNDYSEDYMAERSAMPVYGNVVRFSNRLNSLSVIPGTFTNSVSTDGANDGNHYPSSVKRDIAGNKFVVEGKSTKESVIETPFDTEDSSVLFTLLADTLHKIVSPGNIIQKDRSRFTTIHSRPLDSMLTPMMHRSDNFFAEQSLLMVSNQLLGVMNDGRIIDTLLKTDFSDLPQKPKWVDGSGLSRYNLFTPQDFVAILNKMQKDFGLERIKHILPTGNTGTLANYYKAEEGYIFAKTGTLSGVVSLSGYLYTRKNKLLIFSVLVNNHQGSASTVRRAVEKFVEGIREKF